MIRWQRAKRGNILVKTGNGVLAQPVDADRPLGGAGDDLVVDIGNVANIGDALEASAEQPHKNVEHHDRARIADMS